MPRRLALAGLCALLALVGCSRGDKGAKRDDSGRVSSAGMVSVFELRAGDCLDPPPDLAGDIDKIMAVPCSDAHTQEVFGVVQSTAATYPGPEALAVNANGLCLGHMQEELGLSPDDGYFITYLLPSFDGWNSNEGGGDRAIVCVFVFPNLGRVTGSVVAAVESGAVEPGSPPPVTPVPLDAD